MNNESNNDAIDILSELENSDTDLDQQQTTSKPELSVDSQPNVEEVSDSQPNVEEVSDSPSSTTEISESQINNQNEDKSQSDEKVRNVIFVGNKTIMTYVNSTLTKLSDSAFVTIKARGKRITQAVDISQFIIKRMNSVGYKISDVRISSESLLSNDGKKRNVSLLEIDLTNTND
jgi:DNA-binding protein|tara:strand:+ start:8153 stop:8677 length:525 start_codon:yes stop_codon:yes gene_type:complete